MWEDLPFDHWSFLINDSLNLHFIYQQLILFHLIVIRIDYKLFHLNFSSIYGDEKKVTFRSLLVVGVFTNQ